MKLDSSIDKKYERTDDDIYRQCRNAKGDGYKNVQKQTPYEDGKSQPQWTEAVLLQKVMKKVDVFDYSWNKYIIGKVNLLPFQDLGFCRLDQSSKSSSWSVLVKYKEQSKLRLLQYDIHQDHKFNAK